MIKRILFILVLCLMLCLPVCAWSNIFSHTFNTVYTTNKQFNGIDVLKPANFELNGTRLTWEGTAYCSDLSLTQNVWIRNTIGSGHIHGNATVSRTCSIINNYSAVATLDIQISDFDNLGDTVETTYLMEDKDHVGYSWVYYHTMVGSDDTQNLNQHTSDVNAAVLTSWTDSTPVIGVWNVYGGSATPPSTNRSITVHTKNLAEQNLPDMYVEVYNADISYATSGTTNSTGYVVFPDVVVLDDDKTVTIHVTSSGIYESYDHDFEITANTLVEAVMLSASPSGTYRNITYFIQNSASQPLAGIYLNHIVSPDFQLGDYSNSTGYIRFLNVPVVNDAGYYEIDESYNPSWHDSSGFFSFAGDMSKTITLLPTSIYVTPTPTLPPGQTVTPTPTPTPIGQYALYLTALPDSINLGSSVTLTGSSSYSTALTYAGGLRRTSFYVNMHPSLYPFDYQMIGIYENVNATHWKFRANNNAVWQTATTASPLTMTHTPTSNGLITYGFNAYDTSGNAISTAGTDDVLVGGGAGSGSLTIKIGAFDATTNSQLMNYVLNVTDEASGTTVEYGNITYDQEITLPRGNGYVARVAKTGYQTSTVIGESGTLLFIVPTSPNIQKGDFGAYFRVPLFPDGSVIAGNTTVSSRVYDIETYYPLSGVQVVNSYAPTDIKYTGTDAESVSWVIPQNTAYSLTASKSGYCSVTEARNTGTNAYQWIPLYLKYGSCAGATATPTPTPTTTPTATPIGGWGNTTGSASVCGTMPANATIIDILKNSMACNGLEDTQSQNLGMSMLIILFASIILGRIAKGVGVLAGAIIGTVIATVAGFLPFWIIIVVIILAGLVFAGKVFWSNSQ